jgi:polyhydroxybutyrate depolymerase
VLRNFEDGGVAMKASRRRGARARFTVAVVAAVLIVPGTTLLAPWSGHSLAAASTKKASPGCGTTAPSTTTLTPKVNGHVRTVIVHVPTSYSSSFALPLVLNLHGSGSTAFEQELFTGMDETANEDNFIVAYPQALIPDGTGFDWNVPNELLIGGRVVPKGSANDIKFLTALVGILEQKYCVNPEAVYATGFSGGAREASQLACDDSTIFAAVAPVSGLRHPTPCPATRAVPIISFHGSDDPVDPFDGSGQAYWTYSVPKAAKDWASQDGCAKKSKVTKSIADIVLTKYGHCSNGAAVELYEVLGEGHEWPGGPVMPPRITLFLGPQSTAINASQLMWEFFSAHRL